jgi:hypothetical protein
MTVYRYKDESVIYTVHTEPTIIPRAGIFIEDVESWLPYTSAVKRNMEVLYSGFMIDEERLVGLMVCVIHPEFGTAVNILFLVKVFPGGRNGEH